MKYIIIVLLLSTMYIMSINFVKNGELTKLSDDVYVYLVRVNGVGIGYMNFSDADSFHGFRERFYLPIFPIWGDLQDKHIGFYYSDNPHVILNKLNKWDMAAKKLN